MCEKLSREKKKGKVRKVGKMQFPRLILNFGKMTGLKYLLFVRYQNIAFSMSNACFQESDHFFI
jgi:hypothetical protein